MAKKIEAAEIVIKTTDGNSFKILGQKIDKTTKKVKEYGAATKNADRETKGITQQSANATKNFSKMATMQGGLVSIYATIAAQVFALSAAFMFLKDAFETRNLVEGQLAFGAATGVAYGTLTKQIQDASGGMIQFKEAAQAAAIGTAAGLSASQLERLGAAAKNTSLALGRDMTDSFQRLVRGTTKAEPELLDELGIILRLEPALQNYANSIGKSVGDLNQFEKSQAIANEVLGQAESKFGIIAKTMDPAGFALQKFLKAFDDLMKGFKTGITNFLIPIIDFFSKNIMSLIGALTLFLVPILRQILPDFGKVAQAANDKAQMHKAAIQQEVAALEIYKAKLDEVRNAENKEKTLATQDRDKIASDMGVSSTTTGQLNAIRHYENQTKEILAGNLKERTGMLKKFNAGQVNDLKKANERIRTSSQSTTLKIRIYFSTLGKKLAVTFSTIKMKWFATMAFMVKAAKVAAVAIDWAMKAMGIIGIILMVVDALMMLWNWIFPPDEAKAKQQEMLDETIDKYAGLKEETDKMVEVQAKGILTYSQGIEQIGNAFKSVDIKNVIKDYNALVAADKVNTKEGQEMIGGVVENLKAMTHGGDTGPMAELIKALESGKAIDDIMLEADAQAGVEGFQGYAEALMNAATASGMLAEKQKSLSGAIRSAMGSVKENQFVGVLKNLDDMIETQKASIGEKGVAQKASLDTAQYGARTTRTTADEAESALKGAKRGRNWWTLGIMQESEAAWQKRQANLLHEYNMTKQIADEAEANYEKALEDAAGMDSALAKNERLRKRIVALMESEWQLATETKLQEFDKALISTTNKDAITKNLHLDAKLEDQRIKQKEKVNELEAARLLLDTASKEQLEDKEWKKQAQQNIKNLGIEVETGKEKIKRAEELTEWQKALNVEKEKDLTSTFNINKLVKEQQRNTMKLKNDLAAAVSHQERFDAKLALTMDKQTKITTDTMKRNRLQEKIDELNGKQEKDLALILQLERQRDLIDENILNTQQQITNELHKQLTVMHAIDAQKKVADAELSFQNRYGTDKSATGIFGGAIGMLNPNAAAQRDALTAAGVSSWAEHREKTTALEYSNRVKDDPNAKLWTELSPTEKADEEARYAAEAKKAEDATKAAANASAQIKIETELASSVQNTLAQGFQDMFMALIDGTQSFGDAMKGVMKQVLADLAAAYMKAAALKMLSSMGFGLPARYGGILSPSGKSFAAGGVASGPESGYLATLHGTEAVVPLGNDRAIPVEMRGQPGGNVVNVTVNMAEGGQSTMQSDGEANMQGMGRAIGSLVQQHLQQEMRPGGLLNQQGSNNGRL